MADPKYKFSTDEITVTWDHKTCIHAAVCVGTLPKVYKPGEKPWIKVNAASKEEVIDSINKCPSGALQYQLPEE